MDCITNPLLGCEGTRIKILTQLSGSKTDFLEDKGFNLVIIIVSPLFASYPRNKFEKGKIVRNGLR